MSGRKTNPPIFTNEQNGYTMVCNEQQSSVSYTVDLKWFVLNKTD